MVGALGQLQLEDEVWLQDTIGSWSRSTLVWFESSPDAVAPLAALRGPTDRPVLTLITCGGVFGRLLGQSLERRVVRTERAHLVPGEAASEPARSTRRDTPWEGEAALRQPASAGIAERTRCYRMRVRRHAPRRRPEEGRTHAVVYGHPSQS